MNGYTITDKTQLDDHVTFIRINPSDIELTLKDVFTSIANLAWISEFDKDYIQKGFRTRAEATVKYISENIIRKGDDKITSDSAESVVSELARKTVVNELSYLDIPLGELIKIKDIGNHGFDFFSKNNDNILLFGEAKYVAAQNGYGRAFKQIVKFESIEQKDVSDIIDIDRFCCEESKSNHAIGKKGFMAAFSTKTTATDKLIKKIKNNAHYKELVRFDELICIAVDL